MSLHIFKYPHLASRLFNTPLAIEVNKLRTIAHVFASCSGVELHAIAGSQSITTKVRTQNGEIRPYRTVNAKAIIPVFGTLVQRTGSMDAESGLTSYEFLRRAVTEAVADSAIGEMVLHVDSGGGEASGLVDFMAFLREAKKKKPMTAITDNLAASAAYGIFSTADQRIVTQDAIVGSIGVRMLHVDQTARNEQAGLVVTEFFAGARKVDFSPHESLTDEKRTALQSLVDSFYEIFTGAVAESLGVSQLVVKDTEAGLFVGQAGIDTQLATDIGTLEGVLSRLPKVRGTAAKAQTQTPRRNNMEGIQTVAELRAAYPTLCQQIEQEGADAARVVSEVTERKRIQEICDLAPLGCEAIAQECAFTAPVSAAEAAKKFLAHQKTQGATQLQRIREDAPVPVSPAVPEQPSGQKANTLSPEAQRVNQENSGRLQIIRSVR